MLPPKHGPLRLHMRHALPTSNPHCKPCCTPCNLSMCKPTVWLCPEAAGVQLQATYVPQHNPHMAACCSCRLVLLLFCFCTSCNHAHACMLAAGTLKLSCVRPGRPGHLAVGVQAPPQPPPLHPYSPRCCTPPPPSPASQACVTALPGQTGPHHSQTPCGQGPAGYH